MKALFKLMLLPLALIMLNCSDERIAPRETSDNLTPSETDDRSALLRAYGRKAFVIQLTPLKYSPEDQLPAALEMHVSGTGGEVAINWGDGTVETITIGPYLMSLTHQYQQEKNYTVKMTGAIRNIYLYSITHQQVALNDLYLGALSGLKNINIVFTTRGPRVVDLSHNTLLEDVDVFDLADLQDIIIPKTNNITSIRLFGTGLTTQAVDEAIDRVYQSVVKNPRPGGFALATSWAQDPSSDDMVGPPSSAGLDKLRILRDTYGWGLNPDFDNN